MDRAIRVILTSIDSAEAAAILARRLVDERLAACVQLSSPGRSFYRWQGEIEEAAEHYLSIKTTAGKEAKLTARLVELHPYDTPEIVVLDAAASESYARWMAAELDG